MSALGSIPCCWSNNATYSVQLPNHSIGSVEMGIAKSTVMLILKPFQRSSSDLTPPQIHLKVVNRTPYCGDFPVVASANAGEPSPICNNLCICHLLLVFSGDY